MPKYRSGYERRIAASLRARKLDAAYEEHSIIYRSYYIPDWVLPNGIVIEAKGHLKTEDRTKMLKVKRDNPDLDIRFMFQRASNKIYAGSKTTYADWAERNGFKWAEGIAIPKKWFNEKKKTSGS